jgi:hypothetical protein
MPIRTGLDAFKDVMDRAKSGGSGGDRVPTNWFSWSDGEAKILRFLTDADEVLWSYMHDYVPCKDGKRRNFVCRKELGDDCELCGTEDVRRRECGWGVAVLRQEVREEVDGRSKVVGYTDWTEEIEVEENGKKLKKVRPFVGVVRQSPSNFWLYILGAYEKYGSLLERDMDIARKGGDKNTVYLVYPCDPVDIPNVKERYRKFSPDVRAMVETIGSKDYYDTHLHGKTKESSSGTSTSASTPAPSAPSSDGDELAELARLRAAQETISASASTGASYS